MAVLGKPRTISETIVLRTPTPWWKILIASKRHTHKGCLAWHTETTQRKQWPMAEGRGERVLCFSGASIPQAHHIAER
jgi:hypothetical protein